METPKSTLGIYFPRQALDWWTRKPILPIVRGKSGGRYKRIYRKRTRRSSLWTLLSSRNRLTSNDRIGSSVNQGCRNERDDDMSQTSRLARQVTLDEAWSSSEHSEICCLIYATQNGWKLPILFEEMGVAL